MTIHEHCIRREVWSRERLRRRREIFLGKDFGPPSLTLKLARCPADTDSGSRVGVALGHPYLCVAGGREKI